LLSNCIIAGVVDSKLLDIQWHTPIKLIKKKKKKEKKEKKQAFGY
jgi:hypothetical protein